VLGEADLGRKIEEGLFAHPYTSLLTESPVLPYGLSRLELKIYNAVRPPYHS
jgi:hypothetical protein